MTSKSKKRLQLAKWRKEVEFVNHWPNNNKLEEYNPLIDKHNQYYFQLPSIQKHLKKLKKKAKKEQSTSENQAFIQGLTRNRIIFGKSKSRKSLSANKFSERSESVSKNRMYTETSRAMSTKKLDPIKEQLPRLSMSKKFPSVRSQRVSPVRTKTQRQVSIERFNVMEQIIKRRLGTTFE